MTWQDPGGNAPPGGSDDEATRSDLDLRRLDALVGAGGAAGTAPPGPPGGPGAVPPVPPSVPPPWSAPPGGPGYPAVPPGAPLPGMAWAPPPSYGPGPGAGGLVYAGVPERLVAWLVDVVLLGAIGFAISLLLGLIVVGSFDWTTVIGTGRTGRPFAFDEGVVARTSMVALVGAALSTALDLAYFVLQWSSRARATLGMRIVGLQVGNAADGRTIDRGQALRRWLAMGSWLGLLSTIPLVGAVTGLAQIAWCLVLLITTSSSPTKQGLHDQFAGTAIVKPAGESRNGVLIGCLVLLVLVVVVIPLISIIALIGIGSQVSDILSQVGDSI